MTRRDPSTLLLAPILKQTRHDLGLSQAEAAERVGVTQAEWSAYETGKRLPPMAKVHAILNTLGWRLRVERMAFPGREYLVLGVDGRGVAHTWDGGTPLVVRAGSKAAREFLDAIGFKGEVFRPQSGVEVEDLCLRRVPGVIVLGSGLRSLIPDPEVLTLTLRGDGSLELRGAGNVVSLRPGPVLAAG